MEKHIAKLNSEVKISRDSLQPKFDPQIKAAAQSFAGTNTTVTGQTLPVLTQLNSHPKLHNPNYSP